jgi:hypothetical protein
MTKSRVKFAALYSQRLRIPAFAMADDGESEIRAIATAIGRLNNGSARVSPTGGQIDGAGVNRITVTNRYGEVIGHTEVTVG